MEPKLRLKGFEGEWKEMPFLQIAERVSAVGKSGLLPGVEFEDIISGEGQLNKNIIEKSCFKIGKAFKPNDILFGKLRPYLRNIFLANFEGIAIGDFWVLRTANNDSAFLYYLVNTGNFMRVANVSSGSKMPRADWNYVSSSLFSVPTIINEQKSIASYFQHLDSIIQSSEKKIASLKQVKAASLQAMFPQDGATTPKMRFKGFEGEWKRVKLGKLFSERVESDMDAEMLSVTLNNGIIKAAENGRCDNSNSDKSKYKLVRVGDIAYNSMRMWQGASGCSPYEGIVSPAYTVIVPQDGVCSLFFAYLFKTDAIINLFRLHSQGLTKDTWNLKYPAFSQIEVRYPESIAEQQQIAQYFTALDEQIAHESQRLEKLKQVKAACLDMMFV